jgi:hypothetical protein
MVTQSVSCQKFIPYHYPAIFDRTYKAVENSQGVVCALLCATALEAFVHDVIGWYDYVRRNLISYGGGSYPKDNYLNESEISLLDKLQESESKRLSVFDKYDCFMKWNKCEQPYQDFKALITIRNSLAHLKPEELSMQENNDPVDGYPKFLSNFFQNKIIEKPTNFISWIELIETRKFCLWCQNSAYKMIESTLLILPESNTKIHFKKQIYFTL